MPVGPTHTGVSLSPSGSISELAYSLTQGLAELLTNAVTNVIYDHEQLGADFATVTKAALSEALAAVTQVSAETHSASLGQWRDRLEQVLVIGSDEAQVIMRAADLWEYVGSRGELNASQQGLALELAGHTHIHTGNRKKVWRCYQEALHRSPDNQSAIYWTALEALSNQDFAATVRGATHALELDLAPMKKHEFLLLRARARYGQDDFSDALVDLNEAINLDPDCATCYRLRGLSQFCLQQYPDALQDFERLVSLAPNEPENYGWRGAARLGSEGSLEDSANDLKRAINSSTKSDVNGNFFLRVSAVVNQRLGRMDAALEDMAAAIAGASDDYHGYLLRAKLRASVDHGAVLEDCERALTLRPEDRELRFSVGTLAESMGEYALAEREFLWLVKRHPDNTDYHTWLGRVRFQAKDYSGAIEAFSHAIDTDPDKTLQYNYGFPGFC